MFLGAWKWLQRSRKIVYVSGCLEVVSCTALEARGREFCALGNCEGKMLHCAASLCCSSVICYFMQQQSVLLQWEEEEDKDFLVPLCCRLGWDEC